MQQGKVNRFQQIKHRQVSTPSQTVQSSLNFLEQRKRQILSHHQNGITLTRIQERNLSKSNSKYLSHQKQHQKQGRASIFNKQENNMKRSFLQNHHRKNSQSSSKRSHASSKKGIKSSRNNSLFKLQYILNKQINRNTEIRSMKKSYSNNLLKSLQKQLKFSRAQSSKSIKSLSQTSSVAQSRALLLNSIAQKLLESRHSNFQAANEIQLDRKFSSVANKKVQTNDVFQRLQKLQNLILEMGKTQLTSKGSKHKQVHKGTQQSKRVTLSQNKSDQTFQLMLKQIMQLKNEVKQIKDQKQSMKLHNNNFPVIYKTNYPSQSNYSKMPSKSHQNQTYIPVRNNKTLPYIPFNQTTIPDSNRNAYLNYSLNDNSKVYTNANSSIVDLNHNHNLINSSNLITNSNYNHNHSQIDRPHYIPAHPVNTGYATNTNKVNYVNYVPKLYNNQRVVNGHKTFNEGLTENNYSYRGVMQPNLNKIGSSSYALNLDRQNLFIQSNQNAPIISNYGQRTPYHYISSNQLKNNSIQYNQLKNNPISSIIPSTLSNEYRQNKLQNNKSYVLNKPVQKQKQRQRSASNSYVDYHKMNLSQKPKIQITFANSNQNIPVHTQNSYLGDYHRLSQNSSLNYTSQYKKPSLHAVIPKNSIEQSRNNEKSQASTFKYSLSKRNQ